MTTQAMPTSPTLDELILIVLQTEESGGDVDAVYTQIDDLYGDVDLDEIEAKLAAARFHRSLFSTKLDE